LISIEELKKRINRLLTIFKRKTKCLACLILDKEGFFLFLHSEKEYQNNSFKKYFLKLFNEIELLNSSIPSWFNYSNQRNVISVSNVDDYLSHGFMIIFRLLSNELIFFTLFPYLIDTRQIYSEFDIIHRKISYYFKEADGKNNHNNLYKLI
jgi:hypothetical protein